jgi:hypothetical protein
MHRLPRTRWSKSRRLLLAALGFTTLALLGTPSGIASDATSDPCPPGAKDRQFCVTVSDTDGVSRSPDPASGDPANYMRYVVTMKNHGGPTLTNARLATQLFDLSSSGSVATTATLVSLTSTPTTGACTETAPGVSACDIGSLASGATFTATFVYTTSTSPAVTGTEMTATATTSERSHDQQPRDPVQESRTVINTTVYENRDDAAATFVPGGTSRALRLVTTESSLGFTTPGDVGFVATVEDFANDPLHCFADLPCLSQTTRSDVAGGATLFSSANPIAWKRRIVDPPSGVHAGTINAIHFYDPIAVGVNLETDTFTSARSFVGIDGVRFSSTGALPAPLVEGLDYFVLGATATTFQVSATQNGKALNIASAGSGAILAERVRVIGDTKKERAKSCSSRPATIPAISAIQLSKTVIETCVWDEENGWMK